MRKITSIILFFSFIVVTVTGLQLDFVHDTKHYDKPSALHSNVEDNGAGVSSMAGHQKSFYPKEAHKWFSYLFIVAGFVHLILNLKAMKSYFRIRR